MLPKKYIWRVFMKKIFNRSLFVLMIFVVFSVTVLSCSAAGVKNTSVDTIGAVMAEEVFEVKVTGEGINVAKNKTMTLRAEVTGVAVQPSITWTSSDPNVATVDENGVVKGENVGRALITATAEVAGQTVEGYYSVNVVTNKNFVKSFLEKNQILSYQYSYVDDYYYTNDKDCWQDTFGYARIFDLVAPYIALEYDYTRVFFTYEERDFMIQLWKGQYGYLLVGAEIGVYTTDAGTYTGEIGDVNHYNCADKEDWLKMEMTCYWKENNQGSYKKAFHREYTEYWWATGFVKGQLNKYTAPRTELKMKARITFKSEAMADLFVAGLRESGFARALGSNQLADDSFYQKGADVWFLWLTKNHECFPGYEGKNS